MTWDSRLQPAAYIAPDGQTRIEFHYEVLRRTLPRKTTVYDFPDASGSYVQDLGVAGRRFPFRIYLTGDDYDLQADQFERVLSQRGPGTLQHPQIGPVPVVPFGDVIRRDDLAAEANQAVFEISFYETIASLYPELAAADAPRDELAEQLASDFEVFTNLDGAIERATERAKVVELTEAVREFVGPVAANVAAVSRDLNRVIDGIQTGVDELLSDPATLAAEILIAIRTPINAARTIEQTARGYRDLILSAIGAGIPVSLNDLQIRGLVALGAVATLSEAVEANQYQTRGEAVAAAAEVAEIFDTVAAWRDQRPADVPDDGSSYGLALEVVATSAGNVIREAFNLAQARRVVTDSNRTIIDLAFDFYGDAEQVDRVITENQLTGSQILTVPRGSNLVYFV